MALGGEVFVEALPAPVRPLGFVSSHGDVFFQYLWPKNGQNDVQLLNNRTCNVMLDPEGPRGLTSPKQSGLLNNFNFFGGGPVRIFKE